MITARKRSLGQGNIFTPVCHSVHRGGMHGCSGVCVVAPGGVGVCVVALGGMHGFIWGGVCGCSWGACMVARGGHAWFYLGGHAWFYLGGMHGFIRGACVVLFGGACMVFSVFLDTMRYGQWAGGTHPTGMHPCWIINCNRVLWDIQINIIINSQQRNLNWRTKSSNDFCPISGNWSVAFKKWSYI